MHGYKILVENLSFSGDEEVFLWKVEFYTHHKQLQIMEK